jgi:hypothetical protein
MARRRARPGATWPIRRLPPALRPPTAPA